MIYRRKFRPGHLDPIRKSRTVADRVVALHNDDYYTPLHVLYQSLPAGDCKVTQGPIEGITYSNRMPGKGRQRANICYHTKYRRQYSGATGSPGLIAYQAGYETDFYSVHASVADSNHSLAEAEVATAWGVPLGLNFLNSGAQGYANDTLVKLKPDLKKFSLPNDLIEWKQMGDLLKLWKKSTALVTNLAGAHLNYKFGWKPLVADLRDLADGLIDFRGKLSFMSANRGQVISSRRTIVKDSIIKQGTTIIDNYNTRIWWGQVNRTAHGYLVYSPLPIVVMGKLDETIRALLSVGGVELNPRIAWDALKFSFIVDWFVSVGDWLETFKVSALDLPIQIIEVYLDYKESTQVDSWMRYTASGGISFDRPLSAGTTSVSSTFHRLPFMPDFATFGSLHAHWPTLNQAELLVSLGLVLGSGGISTFFRKQNLLTGGKHSFFDYDDPGPISLPLAGI